MANKASMYDLTDAIDVHAHARGQDEEEPMHAAQEATRAGGHPSAQEMDALAEEIGAIGYAGRPSITRSARCSSSTCRR